MRFDDGCREPSRLVLVDVEAHFEARAVRQRFVARLDDDRGRRWHRRGGKYERRVFHIVVGLHFRLDRSASRRYAHEREHHLVQWARVHAEYDALGVIFPQLVLASVRLVADDVRVVRPFGTDLGALGAEPVLEDRTRGAEEDECDISRFARVPMDSRVRLMVRHLVVSYLHRVRARVQEEAFAPHTSLEHCFCHACQRVLCSLHLRDAVVIAPRCDNRLALVARCDQRDEGRIECPCRARVEDDDLGVVADRRLVRKPSVQELEERGLARSARRLLVHVV